jgi:hypothetical protein
MTGSEDVAAGPWEPDPATAETFQLMGEGGPSHLEGDVRRLVDLVRCVVPGLVAVTLSLDRERVSLTLGTSSAVTRRRSVAASLSVPLHLQGRPVGRLELYAATPGALDALTAARLARLTGAGLADVVRDGDLDLASRRRSLETARRIEGELTADVASGMLAADLGVSDAVARGRLESAAHTAGVPLAELALLVVEVHADRG